MYGTLTRLTRWFCPSKNLHVYQIQNNKATIFYSQWILLLLYGNTTMHSILYTVKTISQQYNVLLSCTFLKITITFQYKFQIVYLWYIVWCITICYIVILFLLSIASIKEIEIQKWFSNKTWSKMSNAKNAEWYFMIPQ